MALDLKNRLQASVTLVANEFVDNYMAAANGEYVKVYLYLLRHQEDDMTVSMIADGLDHTEADVKRALAYWEKLGVLSTGSRNTKAAGGAAVPKETRQAAMAKPAVMEEAPGVLMAPELPARPSYSADDLLRLKSDEDFSQLLYIAQKYMAKTFTPRECEVFAYLYDSLQLPVELLEYLVEYCVQSGHTSIRYIERVALNWHERGFFTVEAAKSYSESFLKDSYAVMKAFGLTERGPGEAEKSMIETWFRSYGFTRELVVEACNRTLEATHNPSFRYADKILSEWKKLGVKGLSDVRALDQKHQATQSQSQAATAKTASGKKTNNQFHNFNQRDTDYDAIILQGLKEQ